METALRAYLKQVRAVRSSGQATEPSYYSALGALIEALGGQGAKGISQPKAQEYGVPDFIVERNGAPIGHIECKDIGVNLDETAESEQLTRYREALPNLILTDFLEFRWYVGGKQQATGNLTRRGDETLKARPGASGEISELFNSFFSAEAVTVTDAPQLARRMAAKAKILRVHLENILADEPDGAGFLSDLLKSYREILFSNLKPDEFADMQAQTVAYGFFAARLLHEGSPGEFTRQSAAFARFTPFLTDVFNRIAGPQADTRITWILEDLALLLANADMSAILEDFGKKRAQEDPVVHFYEDFLRAYDPDLKELRGVYYTPEPVVSYIVKSVDSLLRSEFSIEDGLSDTTEIQIEDESGVPLAGPRVLILDPAVGTGTFLRGVIAHIRESVADKGQAGAWSSYVAEHLLNRIFGFELLMAPYTIAHLKLAMELAGPGSKFTLPDGQRLNIFLTNSLEEAHESASGPMFGAEIAREAGQADAVKRDRPVMVILGNPPYSGHSANNGKWIKRLLRGQNDSSPENYFSVDGRKLTDLGEQNTKWINNDYIKFVRFAQWRIERTGEGILAFITDHSYLDGPTFRGVRESLLSVFDEVFILDLHGNSKKQERSPDDGVDHNVFTITQGVAISIFVKRARESASPTRVRHADLWGVRGKDGEPGKYSWLSQHSVRDTEWKDLDPRSPQYAFVPRDDALADEYEQGWPLRGAFPVNSVAIVTARDQLAIQWTADDMRSVAKEFVSLSEEAARSRYLLEADSSDWSVSAAQEDLRSHPDIEQHVRPILYRPFDTRYSYYTGRTGGFMCRPRRRVMEHIVGKENLAICVGRAGQVTGAPVWDLVTASRTASDFNLFRRGGNCFFPLYRYPKSQSAAEKGLEINVHSPIPNLRDTFVAALEAGTRLKFVAGDRGGRGGTFDAEDVMGFIYAILHSTGYRSRYADFLMTDYPIIPIPRDGDLFVKLGELGERLLALHVMTISAEFSPRFDVDGTGRVDGVEFREHHGGDSGDVWINRAQYFENVPEAVWNFTVGGYHPARQWLLDRVGRQVGIEEVAQYQRICGLLGETQEIMAKVDDVIDGCGGWPLGGQKL